MNVRLAHLRRTGYPANTTSAGWFGFSDDKIIRIADEALTQSWTHFKLKVGDEAQDDLRRARLVRSSIGEQNKLMLDANQKWDVSEAIQHTRMLAEVKRSGSCRCGDIAYLAISHDCEKIRLSCGSSVTSPA
jgi:L-fuconate dehydratase